MSRSRGLLVLLAAVAASVAFWWLLGREQHVPGELAAGKRLQCASYTPFTGAETPMAFSVDRARLERDLAQLSPQVGCVRIYSVRGMEQIPEVARDFGMKVIAGAWVSRDDADTEREIAGLIALANRHPDVISAVLVGNEVLLRRERTAEQLLGYLRRVQAAVQQPVSYGDVWEFWLQNPSIVAGADFVTIHLLPYWENDPSDIDAAIAAVTHAHDATAKVFPGMDILIGETGWPSQGRQREGAVPGRVNEARFVRGFVAHAEAKGWHYNLIEAFDQPWKRAQEGAVGGYWGVFDAARNDKHILRGPVSNLPGWRNCMALSLALGTVLLLAGSGWRAPGAVLLAAAAANGVVFHLQQMRLFSRSATETGWFLLLAAVALVLGWLGCRRLRGSPRARWHDALIGSAAALAAIEMLGLAFDSRYRHFPLAVFVAPALAAWLFAPRSGPWRERNRALGLLLVLCMPAVLWQETLLNLQALGWLAVSGVMAAGLLRGGMRVV
jgi:exo-beta-1,3-glucanase (GH17 family)